MKMRCLSIGVLLTCLLAFSACTASWAQTIATSQISGTVSDQSGAIIPNATILLTRVDTGEIHTVKSNGSGNYIIADVSAGSYSIKVSMAGFSTYVQNGIEIEVGVSPAINVKLAVGAATQEVVVEATGLSVETESTGVGQVINQDQVVDLPLNGRDPDQLIALAGGATTAVGGDLNSNKNFPTISISVAGGLPNAVNFILDGGFHNEVTNGLNLPQPMPDSLQEFKVDTSALPAQYGDHASAAINAVTKSGGNKFHGDAFDFVRNYALNAMPFFDTVATNPYKDGLKRNQYGGVFGGPIKKDKIFFFGGYEQTVVRQPSAPTYVQVPTVAMMNGDFSTIASAGTTGCQSSAVTLNSTYFGTGTVAGGPNAGQTLPNQFIGGAAAFSPQAVAVMKYIPIAGSTAYPDVTSIATKGAHTGACGYVNAPIPGNSRQNNVIGRVDWHLNTKNSVFTRYFLGINNQPIPATPNNALTENAVNQYNRDQGITAGDTYVFSQNLVNSLRLTANRVVNLRVVQPFFDPSTLGINAYNAIKGYMALSVTGGFGVGGGTTNPGHFNSTSWQAIDDINLIRGNHELAFGVDYIYGLMDTVNNRPANGIYAFNGNAMSVQNGKVGSLGYADFFAPCPTCLQSFSQGLPDLENDGQTRFGAYIQDSWKLSKRLTVNYGFRWEPYISEHNSNGHSENFNMANFTAGTVSSVYTAAPAGMIFDGDKGMPGNKYTNNVWDIFDPRLGIIWDPFGDGKTSVRAGFGIFHDSPQMFFSTRYSNAPPFGDTLTPNPASFANPWLNYPTAGANADPFPGLNTAGKAAPFGLEGVYVNEPLTIKVMSLEQWNLSIQRQMGSWLFSGSYVGNRTVHLSTSYEADPALYAPQTWNGLTGAASNCVTTIGNYQFTPPSSTSKTAANSCSGTGDYNQRRLLILQNATQGAYYSTIGQYDPEGIADYNGLLLSARRQTKYMSLLANFTWSHCLSESETTELTGPSYLIPPAWDPNGRRASYSNCDSDRRKVGNVSLVVKSPTYENHVLKAVVTGWQFSPIFTATTGGFSTISTGSDYTFAGTGNTIATNPANPYGTRTNFGTFGYLTPNVVGATPQQSTWAAPANGAFNYQRPLTIHGPATYELDTALSRTFPIPHLEGENIQFRWEVFNLPNEAILGGGAAGTGSGLSTTITSSTFGNITSAGNPRIMQFALKYNF